MAMGRLTRLLRPRHVAVLGGAWAESVIASCREMGFGGDIWPVHPSRKTIGGIPCFASLSDLPDPPDATFLGVNRKASIDIVAALSAMGGGGVVAFASGFAEVEGGADLQKKLVAAAGDMPLLGPNCYGMINYLDGALLWPDVHGGSAVDSGVAIITQSSNLAINLTMQTGALPIAYMLTLGNQAMVGMAELIAEMAADDRVTAIGLHIEGVSDAAAFANAVLAAKASGKPIVAIKAGLSDAAQKMTVSHTASLAGAHGVSQAFFRRLGVGVTDDIESFLQALAVLHVFNDVGDASILTLSCSGGEASLVADAAMRHGIVMPPLSAAAAADIAATVNPLVTVSNPFDYHTFDWGDGDRLTETFATVIKAGQDISILIMDFPKTGLGRSEDWQVALDSWLAARDIAQTDLSRPVRAAVLSSLPEGLPPHVSSWLMKRGIAPLRGFASAMAALAASRAAASICKPHYPKGFLPLSAEPKSLTESQAKAVLAAYGAVIPRGQMAASLDEVLGFMEAAPIVMKISNQAHKTEHGGVILNIDTAEAAHKAWSALGQKSAVFIEDMVSGAIAEVIIGIARDPSLGLHLVIGSGGVFTELLDDTAIVMLPFDGDDIRAALSNTAAGQILAGFRNKAGGDIDGLVDLALKLQDYCLDHEDQIAEIDLNPVLVCAQGCVVVDAFIAHI